MEERVVCALWGCSVRLPGVLQRCDVLRSHCYTISRACAAGVRSLVQSDGCGGRFPHMTPECSQGVVVIVILVSSQHRRLIKRHSDWLLRHEQAGQTYLSMELQQANTPVQQDYLDRLTPSNPKSKKLYWT